MRGFAEFTFSRQELNTFAARCEFAIRNIDRGTKKATIAAAEEIMDESKRQVPKLTKTLLSSAFYEVTRRTDTAATTWAYEALLGYGGNGDPINPVTGKPASYYMVAVHEDLDAFHPVGKAKFLEDPVREYADKNFKRTVFKYAKESLAGMSD
jgi:GTP cyclohydrolase FolE2